jgi:hypothetical protein
MGERSGRATSTRHPRPPASCIRRRRRYGDTAMALRPARHGAAPTAATLSRLPWRLPDQALRTLACGVVWAHQAAHGVAVGRYAGSCCRHGRPGNMAGISPGPFACPTHTRKRAGRRPPARRSSGPVSRAPARPAPVARRCVRGRRGGGGALPAGASCALGPANPPRSKPE